MSYCRIGRAITKRLLPIIIGLVHYEENTVESLSTKLSTMRIRCNLQIYYKNGKLIGGCRTTVNSKNGRSIAIQ
jgi:hypothetical protein